jgi:hypothetical protein
MDLASQWNPSVKLKEIFGGEVHSLDPGRRKTISRLGKVIVKNLKNWKGGVLL